LHRKVFFFTAILFAVSLPFAEFMISIASGLVFVQSLFFFRWADRRWADRNMWLMVSVLGIYLLGTLFTHNTSMAVYELRKNIFWLLVPAGIALSPRLTSKQVMLVLLSFAVAVTLSSFISMARLAIGIEGGFNSFREAHFVSHIAFSMQVILSFLIMVYALLEKPVVFRSIPPYFLFIWAIWLMLFVVILKSMVGIFAFYFVLLGLIFYFYFNVKYIPSRQLFLFVFLAIWISPVVYTVKIANDYFTIKDPAPEKAETHTINGNPYSFDFNDHHKENGHFVSWFICEQELIASWSQRSSYNYHRADEKGYTISGTLIRYLTSKGLKKDSAGIAALSDRDIVNIENGMANHLFDRSALSVYPRIYETIWEIDRYLQTGDPSDQSLSKRIEFARAAILIVKENRIWGIGTGNWKAEYERAYQQMKSKLDPSEYAGAHLQFLSWAVKFGFVGLLWILFVLFSSFNKKTLWRNPLSSLFFLSVMLACLGEAFLETHVGLAYFTLFASLFRWHWPLVPDSK
jgi:hypothetical protein